MTRVFKLKLHSLLQDIYYGPKPVLGKMVLLIYVIEWQKRGPPHAHILAICDSDSKPRTEEDFDSIVCADRSMRDICKVDKVFGGTPIVFGGDPRQILPVVHHGD